MDKEEIARQNIFSDQETGVADHDHYKAQNESWVVMESCDDRDDDRDDNICDESGSMESSSQENSINSIASSSSSDLVEDASSSKSCSSSASSSSSTLSNGPLYEISELMVHLPLRRGISKFYQGKSQSFTSLASVKSLEDLPKKVTPFIRKKMKPCKSYGGGLDGKLHYPRGIISKKSSSRGSSLLPALGTFRPSVPVQRNCF